MRNVLSSGLLAIFLLSCTKETYIENLVPKKTDRKLNITVSTRGGQDDILLKIEGAELKLSVDAQRYVVYPGMLLYNEAAIGDTALFVNLQSININIDTKYTSIIKYSLGDPLPTVTNNFRSYPFYAASRNPFGDSYASINMLSLVPYHFKLGDSGYISFDAVVNGRKIYGWLHITVTAETVTFHEFGYSSMEGIVAGK